MKQRINDTVIVGAGAAGLMAGIQCARQGLDVLILDGQQTIGSKILISGGGRCNITNQIVTEKDFSGTHPRLIRNILKTFSPEKALDFFQSIGVDLTLEEDGKYFPVTHSAQSVLNSLIKQIGKLKIILKPGQKIKHICFEDGVFRLTSSSEKAAAKTILLATGGLSYPATGCDGSGYQLASSFGHQLTPTLPALTPLLTNHPDLMKLSGVSLPVRLSLVAKDKKLISFEDDFLFTHFGFSGPCVLNISKYWLRAKKEQGASLQASFLPGETTDTLTAKLKSAQDKRPGWLIKRFFEGLLPGRLVTMILEQTGIEEKQIFNQLTREKRKHLIENLLAFILPVTDVIGFSKAEVTSGGIALNEVDAKTLESRLQPGLFFAGEILDVDGKIGGFNFHWAWASSVAAANGIHQFISKS